MPNPESDTNERMDALSAAMARMVLAQHENDRRLAEIEKRLGIIAAVAPKPAPETMHAPEPVAVTPPLVETAPEIPATPTPLPSPPLPPEPPRLETNLGLKWVNRIAAITLTLFTAFVFKYAVDSDWIGPAGRVALGVMAGFAALGLADRTWRGGQKTYAQGISGLGLAVLYLSFYAAFGFYHLVGPVIAFMLLASATAMAGAAALRYDAPAIAALGLLGGYATPILLSTGEDRPWALFSWVLLLDVCALVLARRRNWRRIEILAFAATVLLYTGWLFDKFSPGKPTTPPALFAFVFYALFATSESAWIFYLIQVLATLVMVAIWAQDVPQYALETLLLIAGGLGISGRTNRPVGISVTFGAFCWAYAAWIKDLNPQPVESVFLFLTAAFLIFLCWLPYRILLLGATLTRQDALLLALNAGLYFGASYTLLDPSYHAWMGLFAVALAGAHLGVGFLIWRGLAAEKRDTRPVLLSIGIALTFVTLAAPIQFSEYRTTMAWSLEMGALAWIGTRTRSNGLIYAALGIFLLVLIRLDGVDAWMYASSRDYQTIVNSRFLTFLIAAAAGWAAAFWIRSGWQALAFYLGGHYVMLWALGLEAIGWVARNTSAENLLSAESSAISILMGCYAVLVIAAGVLYRAAVNRIFGLSLIGLVVGKLYLYDVWLMGRIYRIVAFGALGALLLLTSYVYSRNRVSIEKWWNERGTGG